MYEKCVIDILEILGWLTLDAVVRKDAKKINKLFAGITQKIGENANIVDTRNVNSLREWRKNGLLVRISQEFKASNDGSLNNEKTEKD